MDASLEGKVVLVTGGAQGLGAAICRELAAHGASLVVVDRSENVEKAADAFARGEARAVGVRGDVGDERDTARFVDFALRHFDRLDAVVNNAGTDVTKDVDTLAVEEWDRVLRTNLRGPFLLAKAALPALKRQGGDIVNITSTAAKRSWPNASAYHASKWGLLGFSHALHAELRPMGVRVTAIVTGGMRTPFLLDRFPDLDPARLQDPADVARTVRFALTQPRESCIAELTVVPLTESSWP
jgi:NAD(P)-dependent dehydrogenase (short-subunit alcohol dehydrogenase family)